MGRKKYRAAFLKATKGTKIPLIERIKIADYVRKAGYIGSLREYNSEFVQVYPHCPCCGPSDNLIHLCNIAKNGESVNGYQLPLA